MKTMDNISLGFVENEIVIIRTSLGEIVLDVAANTTPIMTISNQAIYQFRHKDMDGFYGWEMYVFDRASKKFLLFHEFPEEDYHNYMYEENLHLVYRNRGIEKYRTWGFKYIDYIIFGSWLIVEGKIVEEPK